ncbi:hypothetical protein HY489_06385 [Candidatus Woesearchaeota archaeon]|nr:hypothetical protein [Candidatus Woesearchaeota archaeon]
MDRVYEEDTGEGQEAGKILDTSVAVHAKSGVITVFTAIEYPPCKDRDFDVLFPVTGDFARAVEIAAHLLKRGTMIGQLMF